MSMRMRLLTIAAVLALLAIPTLVSTHAGNNDPNVVHACIHNASNIVRIVGVTGSCLPGETPAHWDIQGPPGKDETHPDPPCFDNTNRYVNCGNGTVTDTVTGLVWLQQADCLGVLGYAAANQTAAGVKHGDCGLTDKSSPGDWRLPTKDEWIATIAQAVALGCSSAGPGTAPSLTNDAGTGCLLVGPSSFAGVASGQYWSSTSDETNPGNAWRAFLFNGDVFGNSIKVNHRGVWPVRGGSR